LVPIVFGALLAASELRGWCSQSWGILLGLGFGVGLLTALSGLLVAPFRRHRGGDLLLMGLSVMVGCFAGVHLQNAGRMAAFGRCAENAKPLIAAIDKYLADNQKPPADLWDLVPVYLDTIPATGMPRYPKWDYGMAKGEPYELVVHCGSLLGFDSFVYWPSGQYPASLYGGSTERIGAWVYVHE
tara:strand:+ start:52949 stop:53503 length:555 start_codon:yes stop_codon:yes gene_type:complete